MAKSTKQESLITKSHEFIINKLKEKGIVKYDGGIQLFTDQFRDYYNVSINYMGTGVKIQALDIDPSELVEDDMIKICKTFKCIL
jgi:hypothetical protein